MGRSKNSFFCKTIQETLQIIKNPRGHPQPTPPTSYPTPMISSIYMIFHDSPRLILWFSVAFLWFSLWFYMIILDYPCMILHGPWHHFWILVPSFSVIFHDFPRTFRDFLVYLEIFRLLFMIYCNYKWNLGVTGNHGYLAWVCVCVCVGGGIPRINKKIQMCK